MEYAVLSAAYLESRGKDRQVQVDSFFTVALIGGAIVLVIVFAIHAHQQRRLAEMITLAHALGWRFVGDRDDTHDELYAQFEVFRRGHSRYAYNTLHGTIAIHGEPCRVRMGDYHYRQKSGKNTNTYEFSYMIVDLPYPRLPTLLIRPEGIFDMLAGAFGMDDIDFESAEFSKRFHVTSADQRFAYDVVHPRMIEFLMNEGPPVIDIEESKCCVTDGQYKWSPDEFRKWLSWAERFFAQWPPHLVAALRSV
jgi:hypothetical protein